MYTDYIDLIDGTLFKSIEAADEAKRAGVIVPGKLVPKGRKRVAYQKLLIGLVYLGLYVNFWGQWNFSVTLQDWFVKKPLWYR